MPRNTKEIIDQAKALTQRFEDLVPDDSNVRSADSLRQVRQAFSSRAEPRQSQISPLP